MIKQSNKRVNFKNGYHHPCLEKSSLYKVPDTPEHRYYLTMEFSVASANFVDCVRVFRDSFRYLIFPYELSSV